MAHLWLALSFLTRLPVTGLLPEALPPGAMARATRLFPVAGLLIGGVSWAAVVAGVMLWDPMVAAVLGVAVWEAASGGLHLDGLADCIDGWLCSGSPERRRAVMHDPRAGALAAGALALFLMLKVALLHACIGQGTLLWALAAAPVIARAPVAGELWRGPAATPGAGLFGALAPEVRGADAAAAMGVGALLLSPVAALFPDSRLPLAAAALCCATLWPLWRAHWSRLIGGLNGDTLGAAIEIREILVLGCMAMTPLLR